MTPRIAPADKDADEDEDEATDTDTDNDNDTDTDTHTGLLSPPGGSFVTFRTMDGLLKSNLLPLVCLGGAAACAAAWGLWGLIGVVPLAGLALWSAHQGWDLRQEARLEERSLGVFRALDAPTVNKDMLVRSHGLNPTEADGVLNWLVRHGLLTADWEDVDSPLVFRADPNAIPERRDPPPLLEAPGTGTKAGRKGKTLDVLKDLPRGMVSGSPFFGSSYGPKSPGTASILSIFLPGLGQLYSGKSGRGMKIFFATYFGMALFGLGVLVWFWQIGDAAECARKANLIWYEGWRRGLPSPD